MTEVIYTTNISVFDSEFSPVILIESYPAEPHSQRAYQKRRVTQSSCYRLTASRIKLLEALPLAFYPEDLQHLLETTCSDRDRTLISLLLRTGMRIGELLEVQISDISFAERKDHDLPGREELPGPNGLLQ